MLLLADTDSLHGTLSGLATKKLMERAYRVFGDARYGRLATISVAHLYNLRQRAGYERHRRAWTKTWPVTIAIGQRRAPATNNQPGFLRVDSVCQGDQDRVKGLYHINAVDCVTQYEGVATCERISEAFLIPVLEALLHSFPFVIRGFHSDNGSEYINHQVAKLLNKLLIEEQTKSRSRHSNDNARPSRRTAQSCASTWATATSRNASHRWSMSSAAIISIPTSTFIGHACSPKPSPTPKAASASAIPTN